MPPMSSTETAVAATLRDFIERELLQDDGRQIDDETPLVALGILDSASVMILIAFVEERFDVVVPGNIDVRELESIAAIERLVRRLAVE